MIKLSHLFCVQRFVRDLCGVYSGRIGRCGRVHTNKILLTMAILHLYIARFYVVSPY